MLQRTFAVLVPCVGLVALVAGCAGPSASISSDASGPVASALAPARELAGTWRGSFGQISAIFYMDEGECILQIKEDGTFTAACRPSKAGTNNLAKASTWSGTVVISRNRVTLRSSQEAWITLIRSGNTLYGVAEDPLVEATIMMNFDREGSRGLTDGGASRHAGHNLP
jgi:hypothetical protein